MQSMVLVMPGGENNGTLRTKPNVKTKTQRLTPQETRPPVAPPPLAHQLLPAKDGRATVDDPGIYVANVGEMVRISGEIRGRFRFVRYERDNGGDFAVVVGGISGHSLERCFTVDRVEPMRRRRRPRRSISPRNDDTGTAEQR